MPRPTSFVCLAATVAALAACHRDADDPQRAEREEARDLARQAAALASGDSSPRTGRADSGMRVSMGSGEHTRLARGDDPPLGPGDVRVVSTDGMVVLAVIGDTVRTRLGDSAVVQMKRELATEADTAAGGMGGFVARTVQGAMGGALGAMSRFALRVPVRDVRDLRYEGGELHFRTGAKSMTNARFARADAERFIAAVRARQQRPAGR